MLKISSLKELRAMPDGVARTTMEAKAFLCHDGDAELMRKMEDEFQVFLGGNWYLFEEGDDPRNFALDGVCPADLLSAEWDWCELATLENGCFFVFWSTTNDGGPCLFVTDEPWVPAELRTRLEKLVSES